MRPRPGRTSPGTCQGFMGCRPVVRERQDASHTARSCFVWPRHFRGVTSWCTAGEVKENKMKIVTLIARFLLGLVFVVFGLNGFLNFLSMGPTPTGLAGQFIG